MLDSTPTTDGAAAVIVASREWAEQHARRYAVIEGVGLAVTDGYFAAHYRETSDFLGFASTRHAAADRLRAGRHHRPARAARPRRMPRLLHDHRDRQLPRTSAWSAAARAASCCCRGATAAGGDIPVNISGGLQSCGHPVGATGVRMIAEITNQVTGAAGERQVAGARRGLAHTLGGPGVISCVMVLGRRAPGQSR